MFLCCLSRRIRWGSVVGRKSQALTGTAVKGAVDQDKSDLDKTSEDEQDEELNEKQSDEDGPSGEENPDEIAAEFDREVRHLVQTLPLF